MSNLEARENKRRSFVQSVVNQEPEETKRQSKIKDDKEDLTQRSYYLTQKQLKAITLKTVERPDLDKSGVVREALNEYLKDILNKL